ncbi:unnamed protein product [Caenorhabditis sp. 36 PRJEB53466]|nr:unnamed protein product [Caenorhabditis sp. 36 PRJEB53466]
MKELPYSEEGGSIGETYNGNEQSGGKEAFRSQQSLGLITQKFMNLRQKNEVMNLNDVVKELGISKRRVYDVINVLEGLGYVEKVEKNNIKWIGDRNKDDLQDQLEAGVENLRQQERIVEHMLRDAQSLIRLNIDDPINRPYSYIQKINLRETSASITKSIVLKSDMDRNNSFEIQVTDPSSSNKYDMIIRNINGVKSHALLLTHDDRQEDVTLAFLPTNSMPLSVLREKDDLSDTDDLETFVIPTTTSGEIGSTFTIETPGRGLLFSPFKSLIDPTCILPTYSENQDYICINALKEQEAPSSHDITSVVEIFTD